MNTDQLTQFIPTHYAGLPPQVFADAVGEHIANYLHALHAKENAETVMREESSEPMRNLAQEIAELQEELNQKRAKMRIEESRITSQTSPDFNEKYVDARDAKRAAQETMDAAWAELETAAAQMRLDDSIGGEVSKSNIVLGTVADEKGFYYEVSARAAQWGGWGVKTLDDAIGLRLWLADRKLDRAVDFEVSLKLNNDQLTETEFNQLFLIEAKGVQPPPGIKANPLIFKRTKKEEQFSPLVLRLLDRSDVSGQTMPIIHVPTNWLDRNFVD